VGATRWPRSSKPSPVTSPPKPPTPRSSPTSVGCTRNGPPDNGGPFRSFRFEAFIELHPELAHVRTRVRSPGQNGSRERGFGTLEYERLFLDEIDDAVMLAEHAEDYRIEYNQLRPHEAIAWNGTGPRRCTWAWPTPPPRHFRPRKSCQLLDAGQPSHAEGGGRLLAR
jgi:Integrase core domain